MLISIFKNNYTLQLALLIIIPTILWFNAFISPPSLVTTNFDMPLYSYIYNYLSEHKLISSITAFIIVLVQGFFINALFSSNNFAPKTTFLPAFLYILLMSSDYTYMTINPFLFVNTFTIIALHLLFRSFDKKNEIEETFTSSIFISCASLFYAPAILLMLLVWIGLINFNIYKLKNWIISLLGLITPILFIAIYYYLSDKLLIKIEHLCNTLALLPNIFIQLQPIDYVYIGGIFIFNILGIYNLLTSKSDSNVSFRKKSNLMLIFLILSTIINIYNIENLEITFMVTPALSFIIYLFLFSKRKTLYTNIYFTILLALIATKLYITTFSN